MSDLEKLLKVVGADDINTDDISSFDFIKAGQLYLELRFVKGFDVKTLFDNENYFYHQDFSGGPIVRFAIPKKHYPKVKRMLIK